MALYGKLEKILKEINVKEYRKVSPELIGNDYAFFDKYLSSGGGKNEKINVKYKDYNFELNVYKQKDRTTYSIFADNNNDECLIIFVEDNIKMASIHNISYFPTYAREGLEYPGGGSILLKFAIHYLKTNKDALNIKKIKIKDNATLYCKKMKGVINLSAIYMLAFGETWYGKYGFIPYDHLNDKIDIQTLVNYKVDQKLVNIIPLDCTNVRMIIEKTIRERNLEKDLSIEKFNKIYNKYKTYPIIKFFRDFLNRKQFEVICEIFGHSYKEIMESIGLHDLKGTVYTLNI
ncbi:hypothetical protein Catovirus_1_66 [Catovirus CTV1]|uniref:Uncharacterized protein n=1 Tax=Catovirus CTV1 TaxID=1977631 RepID=A0A1V0S8J4_9VIRU|nr:hypothetical protein Catovirus_1_66 [Catovirus CTV1]